MSVYTIVKSYKIYRNRDLDGEPIEEVEGVRLRHWLKERGYAYDQAERMIRQLDDQGSIRVEEAGGGSAIL